MRWVALAMTLLFCMSCALCDNNDGTTPENGNTPNGTNGTNGTTPTPGTPEVIDTQYVRLPAGQERLFTWTSTGHGLLSASISWPGAATLTLYLDKGGIVAQKTGASPLQVSAQVGAAGELWTIGIRNDSATTATASYTLSFTPN